LEANEQFVQQSHSQATVKLECYGPLESICGAERELGVSALPLSVTQVLEQLTAELPEVRPHLSSTACAVGDELVSRRYQLQPGEKLVLIPPVSGG
jgi:molybdopterin converting factor small subunit